jgi:hypothetical protein
MEPLLRPVVTSFIFLLLRLFVSSAKPKIAIFSRMFIVSPLHLVSVLAFSLVGVFAW